MIRNGERCADVVGLLKGGARWWQRETPSFEKLDDGRPSE